MQRSKKDKSGSAVTCDDCMATYKSLTRRWKKNRKLQTQYTAHAEGERRDYYRHYKELRQGAKGKRTCNAVVKSSTFSKAFKRNADRVVWVTFEMFQDELELHGVVDLGTQRARWRARLMRKGTKIKTVHCEK